ncbi:MAG: hypothetical protein CMJ50_04160 [Planctomycetaceae bacterium]|nr:hypothetical protein [Planctomycetaceae bacterium]
MRGSERPSSDEELAAKRRLVASQHGVVFLTWLENWMGTLRNKYRACVNRNVRIEWRHCDWSGG